MFYRGKIINEIADVVGEDVAIKVQQHYAGSLLYISIKSNSQLVKALGVDTAHKLFDAFGGAILKIPLGDKHLYAIQKRKFFSLLSQGYTATKSGQSCGISERCIWNWKKEYDAGAGDNHKEAPLPLFDL